MVFYAQSTIMKKNNLIKEMGEKKRGKKKEGMLLHSSVLMTHQRTDMQPEAGLREENISTQALLAA